jgi:signal transduction histidine kinase/HAMP domain-containing protein
VSIRTRIFAVIGIVVAAAFVQTLVVVRLEERRAATNADLDEALQQYTSVSAMCQLVVGLQNAQRGYLLTGAPALRHDYDRLLAVYERTVTAVPQALTNSQTYQLVVSLDGLVRDWHAQASLPIFALREQSADLTSAVNAQNEPRRQKIDSTLDQLGTLTLGQLTEQRNRSSDQLVVVTLASLTIPAVVIVMLLALVAVLARIVLDPLAKVAESARQISSGNFDVTLPADSQDEIGALVRAFRDMTGAVQRRQHDLTNALTREREISRMYAALRTKAEQEHGRLLATISTVPAALVILEAATGRIVLQNKAADELIGREPDDAAEREEHWTRLQVTTRDGTPCPPSAWPPTLALCGQVIVGQELIVHHADGRTIPILVSAAPLRDDHGHLTGAVSAFQDITNLYEVDRLKSEFVSIVSHELRTPLTSIKGALQLLLSEVTLPDPDHRTLMDVALSNTDRLIRIINDILDISKIEAGKLVLNLKPCAVDDLVRHSMQSVATIARGASVTLDPEVPAGLPNVLADADRSVQAIVNLLSNALKYAPAGSNVTFRVQEQADRRISFAVTDRGRGIPADQLGSLFQKFQQLDGSDSRKVRGTGLGLAITKALVEAQGGTVSVQSEVNKGSTFAITLPMVG